MRHYGYDEEQFESHTDDDVLYSKLNDLEYYIQKNHKDVYQMFSIICENEDGKDRLFLVDDFLEYGDHTIIDDFVNERLR